MISNQKACSAAKQRDKHPTIAAHAGENMRNKRDVINKHLMEHVHAKLQQQPIFMQVRTVLHSSSLQCSRAQQNTSTCNIYKQAMQQPFKTKNLRTTIL